MAAETGQRVKNHGNRLRGEIQWKRIQFERGKGYHPLPPTV